MSLAVKELDGYTLLNVSTRGDAGVAAKRLAAALAARVTASPGEVAVRDDGLAVLWFGPGRWLVHAPRAGVDIGSVEGCVTTDLSDSRRVFRLSGSGVCDFLAASSPLDLSGQSMRQGSCALTQFDRFSILLHRHAPDAFDLYVERSYAPALRLPS